MKQGLTINRSDIPRLRELQDKLPLATPSYTRISWAISCCLWMIVITLLYISPYPVAKHTPVKIYSIAIHQTAAISSPLTQKKTEEKPSEQEDKTPPTPSKEITQPQNIVTPTPLPKLDTPPPQLAVTPIVPPPKLLYPPKQLQETLSENKTKQPNIEQVVAKQNTPAISTMQINEIQSNYWSQVSSAITKNLKYPATARIQRLQGHASIRISINANGKLLDAVVQKASRRIFSSAVLAAANRAAPFPPLPNELQEPLILNIPVSFRL